MTGGRPGPAMNHFHRHHSHEANMLHKYKHTMLKRKKKKKGADKNASISGCPHFARSQNTGSLSLIAWKNAE